MDLIKFFKSIFGKKDKQVYKQPLPREHIQVSEHSIALRQLEDQQHEEMRIAELEANVRTSFEAIGYELSYMDNKVVNIAGHLSLNSKLSFAKTADLFETGIHICDCAIPNPFKFPKVIKYYYDNFYSDDKQLEYYNRTHAVIDKYAQLEKELNEKYR